MGNTDIKSGMTTGSRPIPRGRPPRLVRWIRLGRGKLRRFFLVHLNMPYVQDQLRRRKGKCSQCGCCCKLIFPCAMLTRRGLCRIYGGRRWLVCTVFPIDKRDLADVELAGGNCGYHWASGPDSGENGHQP